MERELAMRLIVIREQDRGTDASGADVLRYALSVRPLSNMIHSGACRFGCPAEDQSVLSEASGRSVDGDCLWAVPEAWRASLACDFGQALGYTETTGIGAEKLAIANGQPWSVISNGRFITHVNGQLFRHVLEGIDADVVAVVAEPELVAYRERVRLAQAGRLVGYRRLYRDSAEPIPMPLDWPHHLLIRGQDVNRVLAGNVPLDFGRLIEVVRSHGLNAKAVAIAGSVVDLGDPEGLLSLAEMMVTCAPTARMPSADALGQQPPAVTEKARISSQARIIGPVLFGQGVCVEAGAIVVGPSVLCDNCTVGSNAVVDSSIVGAETVLEPGRVLRRTFVMIPEKGGSTESIERALPAGKRQVWTCPRRHSVFRVWPRLSYARFFKRIADVIVAAIVLILFAPIIPLIALAVKLNSPGPAFFKDKRQGLHGKLFDCIKFRTMHVGAADIQDKLRFVSEVDGPQFKMADDPRISTVGRFLRETYLDEIPQFYNVLCGQMSIVGPRPSPEKENTLCPSWRDARLSVRPGITGYWQVCRTRRPFKDFQEWIFYDTKYVRELSPWVDVRMCWGTFKKMVENFIRQF